MSDPDLESQPGTPRQCPDDQPHPAHEWNRLSHNFGMVAEFCDGVEPLKDREEDQPLPIGDPDSPDVQRLVIDDIEERLKIGVKRYRQGLKAFNGRVSGLDLYQELLDAVIYKRAEMEEAKAARGQLVPAVERTLKIWLGKQEDAFAQPGIGDFAEVAVDAIMGWVAGQLTGGRLQGDWLLAEGEDGTRYELPVGGGLVFFPHALVDRSSPTKALLFDKVTADALVDVSRRLREAGVLREEP